MSGICGIASAKGSADPDRVARMSATLAHRGPDSFGEFSDGTVALAARRLSIIDLETGDQPIANEDGTLHVVQDGAIYNYRELRWELERTGHHFGTQSDAEVVLHLYEEHGVRFADRLRGMFAIAIWDAARRRLVLARDRFGIKPLYYREGAGELTFASELRALPRGELDPDALEAFLAFNSIPAPLTIFRDIRKLSPGHLLIWESGRVQLEPYTRPALVQAGELRDDDEAELVEELRSRLRDSVRAHLVSDVPVGVLLSGGVHSSFVTALAAEETSEPLRTFSIGFGDELGHARHVAARYSTEHRELVLRPDPASLLRALADAFDEPFADATALPTYLVSQLAVGDVKAALSGNGAEMLFDGEDEDLSAHLSDDVLVKTDRASMANSLQARVPYVDTVVTNLALAVPSRSRKLLLRKAAQPLLPREIMRGGRHGFSIPAAAWLRGELKPFAREILSAETLRRQGFFRPEAVTPLIDEHAAGHADHSRRLWGLLAFTLWHERHVEQAPSDVSVAEVLVER
jgi:asparagine synthase (glutamine-hydrolysing)